MPTINVARHLDIDASLDDVYPLIAEFKHWPHWSPWLCQEPEVELEFSGADGEVGSGYSWAGTRIGAGSMQLSHADKSRISCDLSFLKPFKSQAHVTFNLERLADKRCRVTWRMLSGLPFFMFFMQKSFEAYIGGDYQRGLSMLKELAETGEVKSKVEVLGLAELPATEYIGLNGSGTLAELGPFMQEHFPKLAAAVTQHELCQTGPAFCHYRVMDPVRDRWQFMLAVPITGDTATLGFERGTRPQQAKCAHVRHSGHYHHLGNAWAAAFAWLRAEKHRQLKKAGGYEVYLDDPKSTDVAQLRTDIYVPIK